MSGPQTSARHPSCESGHNRATRKPCTIRLCACPARQPASLEQYSDPARRSGTFCAEAAAKLHSRGWGLPLPPFVAVRELSSKSREVRAPKAQRSPASMHAL
jgi:hypothetical protein